MRTRNVLGQRIVRVEQGRTSRGHGYPPANTVNFLELENGMRLFPMVKEGDAEYFVDFLTLKKGGAK